MDTWVTPKYRRKMQKCIAQKTSWYRNQAILAIKKWFGHSPCKHDSKKIIIIIKNEKMLETLNVKKRYRGT